MPVEWNELSSVKPQDFTLHNAAVRIAEKGDLFKNVLDTHQNLDAILAQIN